MDVRQSIRGAYTKALDTQGLRNGFLVEKVFVVDECTMVYSHIDRVIISGVIPVAETVSVGGEVGKQLNINYFPERRELGVINIGGAGTITVDGQCYGIDHRDALYVGKGTKKAAFASVNTATPAKFYHNCVPACTTYLTKKVTPDEVSPVTLGDNLTSNRHTISKCFVPDMLEIYQLDTRLTKLALGSLWNTMLCHTHGRWMEVYFYLSMDDDTCIFHIMGQPQETHHAVVYDEQAVILPSWSVHPDVGTKVYTFIWGMVGKNQVFDDVDHTAIKDLRQLQV